MKEVKIQNKIIGENHPCYTVAEIGGAFHNIDQAKRLIDSAVEIKVDAVKFQTLEAETITTKNNLFDLETTGKVSQYELFKEAEISKELQLKVVKYANDKGITIFSAPSHINDLEIMKEMDLAVYKIGSDLACHTPLLKEVSKIGKPIILSTGMCTLEEVKNSVNTILAEGNDQLIVLHCVSDYPTKLENVNLNAILTMKEEFNIPVGYSDHTVGNISSLAAVSLGANMIERHFRDIENPKGVDDLISLVKDEFQDLINNIRLIEQIKGTGIKNPTKLEQKNLLSNKVSIISLQDINQGETITSKTIDIRRPGNGIQPIDFEKVIGKKSKIFIPKETPIQWEMIE
jgi:N,N'-diacetyllegionaminate synthase